MLKTFTSRKLVARVTFLTSIMMTAFTISCLFLTRTHAQEPSHISTENNPVVIQINDTKISLSEYQSVLNEEIRNRFYHSKVSQEEKANYHIEVANKMIERFLMLEEIKRLQINADQKKVDKKVSIKMNSMDARYKENKQWLESRKQYKKQLTIASSQKNQLEQLSLRIKNIEQASDAEIMSYYKANSDKFMSPIQQRISVIILSVAPSSNNKVWDAARKQALDIKKKLNNGEAFSQLAEIYSTDVSAEMGGDMGSIHEGMLGEAAQKVIDKLKVNEVSEPVTLLEGIALLKLTKRVASKLNTYERVKPQAIKLLHEEQVELKWKQFIFMLRQGSVIIIDEPKLKAVIR